MSRPRAQIEKPQLARPPVQHARPLQLEHPGDESVDRDGRPARASARCGAGARRWRDTRASGSWKNVCSCDALAAAPRVVERSCGRSRRCRYRRARGRQRSSHRPAARAARSTRRLRSLRSQPPYATPRLVVPQPVEAHQRVRGVGGGQHLELEGVVEARVHELEREPDGTRAGGAPDPAGHLAQPAEDADALVGERVAGERRREVLLERQGTRRPTPPRAAPWCDRYSASRNGSSSRGRWYLTEGTASSSPARVRSPAARTRAR